MFALIAAARGQFVAMFAWLGVALIIDGLDGQLARGFKVAEVAPRWSGDVLDFVVDFTTYVFVPAFALATGGVLPDIAAIPLAAGIVVTSALYFADCEMKTDDHHFQGFPALWNAVAFHVFLLKLAPWIAAFVIAVLIVLTFVPFRFVHPLRVVRWRNLTLAVVILWSLLAVYGLVRGLTPEWPAAWIATACAVYLFAAGFVIRTSSKGPR